MLKCSRLITQTIVYTVYGILYVIVIYSDNSGGELIRISGE